MWVIFLPYYLLDPDFGIQDEDGKQDIPLHKFQDDFTFEDLRALDIPEEIDIFFHSFPFTPSGLSPGGARRALESSLPPLERADALCRIFVENLSWMFKIVSLDYLTKELLPAIYIYPTTKPSRDDFYGVHDLALFLIVLSVGALVDPTQQPYNLEAQRYYVMAQAAAGMLSILESNSLSTVKFLHLLSVYNGMSGKESNLSNTYGLLNLAGVMAYRVRIRRITTPHILMELSLCYRLAFVCGISAVLIVVLTPYLDIDPSHWNLDEKTAYERRAYFWNLMIADLWQVCRSRRHSLTQNKKQKKRFLPRFIFVEPRNWTPSSSRKHIG